MFLQSVQDFTGIAFKDFLCGVFVHLATHHIASELFETLHTSPNHCFWMKRLSLSQWWCTKERFLEFAYGFNILPLSFMCQTFWKFANSHEITWNFAQMTEQSSLIKELSWDYPVHILVLLQSLQNFTYIAFKDLPSWYIRSFGNSWYCTEMIWASHDRLRDRLCSS